MVQECVYRGLDRAAFNAELLELPTIAVEPTTGHASAIEKEKHWRSDLLQSRDQGSRKSLRVEAASASWSLQNRAACIQARFGQAKFSGRCPRGILQCMGRLCRVEGGV